MIDCDCTTCAYAKKHPQLNAPRCGRVTADTITEATCAALDERKLYIVRPQHPTMGEVALEFYGFGKACDAVALQGDDLTAFGARCAEILSARAAKERAE